MIKGTILMKGTKLVQVTKLTRNTEGQVGRHQVDETKSGNSFMSGTLIVTGTIFLIKII